MNKNPLPASPSAASSLAIAVLVLAGLAAAFTCIWDFDIFWHLAGGKWMLQEQRVLDFDPFTDSPEPAEGYACPAYRLLLVMAGLAGAAAVLAGWLTRRRLPAICLAAGGAAAAIAGACIFLNNPSQTVHLIPPASYPRWINVYWMFQLLLACLHAIGGFEALSVFKALLAGALMLALGLSCRKRVAPAWLIFCGLLMLVSMAERLQARPEMITYLLMALTMVLTENVRRGAGTRQLWWLVPIMIAWANMHGMFVFGPFLMWSSMLGAAADRRLGRDGLAGGLPTSAALAPLLAATGACLLNPWLVDGLLMPLQIWNHVSPDAYYYTYGVQELTPTLNSLAQHADACCLLVLAVLAMAANWRSVPVGHALWLAAMVPVSLLANRNVGLLAVVSGFLAAWHGGDLLRRPPEGRRRPAVGAIATGAMVILALAVTAAFATDRFYRWRHWPMRFGAGLARETFAVDLAQYLARLPQGGNILCINFGDASTFDYYCSPQRKVWMDGRLEVHSLRRFKDLHELRLMLRRPKAARQAKLPLSSRFIIVRYDDGPDLSGMLQSGRFRLLHLDMTAACFEDNTRPEGEGQEITGGPNLPEFDLPLSPGGVIDGIAQHPRRWYAANPFSANGRLASMFLSLGDAGVGEGPSLLQRRCALLAVRYSLAALAEKSMTAVAAEGLAAQALHQWASQDERLGAPPRPKPSAEDQSAPSPLIDVPFAQALWLYARVQAGPEKCDEFQAWTLGLGRVECLLEARHCDLAATALDDFFDQLPPEQRVNPPPEYVELKEKLTEDVDQFRLQAGHLDSQPLTPERRAAALAALGLSEQAVTELSANGRLDSAASLAMGDLLLRQGRAAEARRAYDGIAPPAESSELPLRRALCDWIEGDWPRAQSELEGLWKASPKPLTGFYYATLLEQVGDYPRAQAVASQAASTAGKDLAGALEQLRRRLEQAPP